MCELLGLDLTYSYFKHIISSLEKFAHFEGDESYENGVGSYILIIYSVLGKRICWTNKIA